MTFKWLCLSLIYVSCLHSDDNSYAQKTEILAASYIVARDSLSGAQLVFENKSDSSQKLKIFIKKGEAYNPDFSIKDTVSKYNYKIREILIARDIDGKYIAKIICLDKAKEMIFEASPVEGSDIARHFSVPIFTRLLKE
ncbi:MAG: hypothetical protein ACTHLE_05920 [Agriterribacter sp.]